MGWFSARSKPSRVSAEHTRITEIWTDSNGGNYGSGYLLGDGLILTARHVIQAQGAAFPAKIKARPLGLSLEEDFQEADLVWPAREELGNLAMDAALIRLTKPLAQPLFGALPVLGPPDLVDSNIVSVRAVGFPAFREGAMGRSGIKRRDTEEISGRVHPGSRVVDGRYEIENDTFRINLPEIKRKNWRGYSGAALLAGDRLVGIVIAVKTPEELYDFSAIRMQALLDDAGFRAKVQNNAEIDDGRSDSRSEPELVSLAFLLDRDDQEYEMKTLHRRCEPTTGASGSKALVCLLPGARELRHCPEDLPDRFARKTLLERSWPRGGANFEPLFQFGPLYWPVTERDPAAALDAVRGDLWSKLGPDETAAVPGDPADPTELARFRTLLNSPSRPRLFYSDLRARDMDANLARVIVAWGAFWASLSPHPEDNTASDLLPLPPIHLLLLGTETADETRRWLVEVPCAAGVILEPLSNLSNCMMTDVYDWLRKRLPLKLGAQHKRLLDRMDSHLQTALGGRAFDMQELKAQIKLLPPG